MMTKKQKKTLRNVCLCLFVIYIVILIYFLLLSDLYGRPEGYENYRYNVVPFREIARFIQYYDRMEPMDVLVNIAGNVLAFSPFGALIRWVRDRKTNVFVAVGYTFGFSLCIEVVQLITKVGVFDVDDLILNTLGGLIGYLGYYILACMNRKGGKRK